MKRILVFLFALMLLLPLCAMRADAAEVIAEYTPHNANLQWYLTDDGVLTFTSDAEYVECDPGAPNDWRCYSDMIKKVVFEGNVKYIEKYAFYMHTNLKEVVFRGSVNEIREYAFAESGLERVEFPYQVTKMGYYVFKNCKNLTTVTFSEDCMPKEFGTNVFEGSGVTSVTLPINMTEIPSETFAGCERMTSFTVPDTVITIGGAAFADCPELKTVTMGKNVTTIDPWAFSNCGKLEDIDLSMIKTIGKSAFSQCHALKSIDLSAVIGIGDKAFYEAKGLESIVWPKNSAKLGISAFEDCDSLKHVELPDTITDVKHYLFANCDNLESLVLSKNVTGISGFPAVGGSKKTYVTVLSKDAEYTWAQDTDDNNGVLIGYAGSTTEAFAKEYSITFVPIHDESHTYGEGKFITEIACGANGVMEFPCNDCDVVVQSIAWAPDHEYGEFGIKTSPKCNVCGEEYEGPRAIRIFGANRFETACKVATTIVSGLMENQQLDTVVIASGAEFADALSGSYLANAKSAPILLAYKGELDEQTMDTIVTYLKPGGTVYILGGYAAVSEKVDAQLSAYTVKRLAGANRFETNLMILREIGVDAGKEVMVCTATNYADSLSCSATGLPILLVYNEKGMLTDDQKAYLATLKNCSFTVAGGKNAVSDQLKTQLEAYGSVRRLAGETRHETSVLVAKTYFEDPDAGVLAYAWNFPDGLCGGVLAYMLDAPLLLSENEWDPSARYVRSQDMRLGVLLGGGIISSDAAVRDVFKIDPNVEIPR